MLVFLIRRTYHRCGASWHDILINTERISLILIEDLCVSECCTILKVFAVAVVQNHIDQLLYYILCRMTVNVNSDTYRGLCIVRRLMSWGCRHYRALKLRLLTSVQCFRLKRKRNGCIYKCTSPWWTHLPGCLMVPCFLPAGLQTAAVSEEQSAGPVQSDREGVREPLHRKPGV